MTKIITKFLLCFALLLSSIDHGGLASPAPDGSSVAADSLEVLYPAVFHEILHHLLTKEKVIAGDYQGDFGDATCYAPPVLMAHGLATSDCAQIKLARSIITREYNLIRNFLFNFSEALIGGLRFKKCLLKLGWPRRRATSSSASMRSTIWSIVISFAMRLYGVR